MKKIISFILLTASASCTILFAQAENRLEATNQVRGCRLQLVATNQTTNYRLQVEDNNKIELSSEGQIRQQAKPTTNCELRTTNCNNSGTDLSCYLMMNPATLEEGEEALGEGLGVFGKKATLSKTPVVATAVAYSPVGSSYYSSSSNASVITPGQRAVDATATVVSDEAGEDNSPAQFLEKEICDNIYLGCLAKVTTMSLSARTSAEGIAQEAKEWAAAEQKAIRDVDKRKEELFAQMIIAKKSEGEAAFARARAAKSESGWNEAKAAAITISNYWNGVIEAIKAGSSPLALSQEEATLQARYWMEKAGVAEVKALGTSPCGDDWEAKQDRADGMIEMIRNKVWPTVSQTMKAFIERS